MNHYKIIISIFSILFVAGCASITDWTANRYFLPNDGVRAATYSVWTERRVGFITSEGFQLFADVHHPKNTSKTPTILVRIPFTNTYANRMRSDIIGRYWASRGYTVVIQGTRGRYESGGQFYPLLYERQDGLETLSWLEEQAWYDGRLVMWGGSSFGHTQWAIADQTNIDALFVQVASTNFQKMFYPGGAFSLESAVYWAIRSSGDKDRKVDIDKLKKGVATLPIMDADNASIGETDFYNDWLLNKNNADFWRKIDGTNRINNLKAPMLLLGGWFDPFLPTQIEDFKSISLNKKPYYKPHLIIGPWGHALSLKLPGTKRAIPYRKASLAPSIPWFDYQLGISKESLAFSPVKIFVMGINEWRDENEWPLARAKLTSFYLHNEGLLSNQQPSKEETVESYTYDPYNPVPSAGGAMLGMRAGMKLQNAVESRDDVLIYSTPPLSKQLEVTGEIRVELYVSTDAVSTDFTAKLVDVHPDGSAYNLSDGIIRQRYNSDLKTPVKIEIELWPTSNVFLKGHKIRLEISSSNFPRYDRNPNTGEESATATKMISAHQKIFHSKKYPSKIILPVIP